MGGSHDPQFSLIDEELLHAGYAFDLYATTWSDSAGEGFERDIIRHRGAVAVVPLDEDREHVFLVRQFRTPLNRWLLELPAGLRDKDGESEIETAHAQWQTEQDAKAYARARSDAYPSLADFAEAYTEKEIGSSSTKWDAYVTAYNKVRSDNPKP